MAIKLGIHTGPQDLSMADLMKIWRMADDAGFYWASVWDHFYANPLQDRNNPCFEAIASMTALAATTRKVRVGCLMFCSLFRNPALLAKAAVTIDHVSGGRVELGVGGGWFEEEFREFGYGFPPIGQRLDMLEEGLQIVRSLLREPVTHFKGKYYELDGAVCAPKPVNPNLRIWVGGRGPNRTPRIAAKYADGFNAPYLSPEDFKNRMEVLDRHCDKIGRDPKAITRTINVHFLMGADEAGIKRGRERLDAMPDTHRGGGVVGNAQEAIDLIGEYERAGAEGLNIAFRAPLDWDAYQAYIDNVLPVFHT